MIFNGINKCCSWLERGFNLVDNVPGMPYGVELCAIRSCAGITQAGLGVAGAVAGLACTSIGFLCSDSNLLDEGKILSRFGVEHLVHGGLNGLRGLCEGLLHLTPYRIGSVALLLLNSKRDFKPVYEYSQRYVYASPIVTDPFPKLQRGVDFDCPPQASGLPLPLPTYPGPQQPNPSVPAPTALPLPPHAYSLPPGYYHHGRGYS